MSTSKHIPIIGFAAYSGTGKTTLLKKLIPEIKSRGYRIAVVKHAHHSFEIDHEGKDSFELRKAGAEQLLIGSRERWALITEQPEKELSLEDYVKHLNLDKLDIVLVEGFKPKKIPKIELYRPVHSKDNEPFYPKDDSIIAIASDNKLPYKTDLPVIDLNNVIAICDFIIDYFKL